MQLAAGRSFISFPAFYLFLSSLLSSYLSSFVSNDEFPAKGSIFATSAILIRLIDRVDDNFF